MSVMEAQLTQLSLDGDRSATLLAEMSRLGVEHREHVTGCCDGLQQQIAGLSELTERCHVDSVTQMTTAVQQQQQQQMMACNDNVSVSLTVQHILYWCYDLTTAVHDLRNGTV